MDPIRADPQSILLAATLMNARMLVMKSDERRNAFIKDARRIVKTCDDLAQVHIGPAKGVLEACMRWAAKDGKDCNAGRSVRSRLAHIVAAALDRIASRSGRSWACTNPKCLEGWIRSLSRGIVPITGMPVGSSASRNILA